jgi:rubrerythrin
MYPEMIADAKAEGMAGALRSFEFANVVEKIHAALYQKMLDNLGKTPDAYYWVCQVCGMTVEGEAPDECPVCKAKKQAFKKVE